MFFSNKLASFSERSNKFRITLELIMLGSAKLMAKSRRSLVAIDLEGGMLRLASCIAEDV